MQIPGSSVQTTVHKWCGQEEDAHCPAQLRGTLVCMVGNDRDHGFDDGLPLTCKF